MKRHVCLICEGIQDSVFIAKLLAKQFQMKTASMQSQQDHPWLRALIGATSPPRTGYSDAFSHEQYSEPPSDEFIHPQQVRFLANHHTLVWLSHAGGVNRLAQHAEVVLGALKRARTRPDALGFVIDSDAHTPNECLAQRSASLKEILTNNGFQTLATWSPGQVVGNPPTGVFVMPNCRDPGTLEDLLIACGRHVYPNLHGAAHSLVSSREVLLAEFDNRDRSEIDKPAGPKKVTLAVMGAFLKPGRTIQTAIEAHRWVSETTLLLPELKPLVHFLRGLIQEERSSDAEHISSSSVDNPHPLDR